MIISKATGSLVGRHLVEDRSLLPKRIMILDNSMEIPRFIVENHGNTYTMKTRGGTVTCMGEKVVAALMEEDGLQDKWVLTRSLDPDDEPNAFIITLPDDRSRGWVVCDTSPGSQVTIGPIVAGMSSPPEYPKSELFKFTPVDE
ncbi:hypothetical protein FRB96_003234 [Tulasnella sp. 330]|nr:hypothetical protein FRB96_003234 [Tulasnella sp. 330]